MVSRTPTRTRPLPASLRGALPGDLGCEAVEMSARHGRLILRGLPRTGAVFSDGARWWWIVPPESHIGLSWPTTVRYWTDATVPLSGAPEDGRARPRLEHWTDRAEPYTHPLLLYIAVCRLAGVPPVRGARAPGS